ncbi:myc box-dependent-interacting protein 1 [Anopheles marshallii]|uniref:myc box-dependent-interacting protein 1 n=1 Tax=Anopheles marshallii TaxID=1521116 RepID=UPI00237A9C6E|nr:myc box-dependent-interacting protein 1 [Anopheles marshallii]
MAENKGMLLAKSVQKHAGRAKEKLLQNLGKVDRTADEIFDEHLTNFNRQHTCATRLQKEFSNYIRCVRAVQNASKSLMDAITEVYESQWTGSEVLYGQTKTIDTQYQQFSYKLADQVLKQLDTYALQFPEMKKKIDKRGRKLVDYDSQRHSFQSLQANAAKRKDDLKVSRGREQLEDAKSTYEVLNSELHDELPALYDSRILFLVTNLQTLFACEQQFHSETSKVYADLEAIVDKLATESQRGSYTLKKINANSNPSSPQQSPVKANLSIVNNVTNGSANANGHTSAQNVLPSPRTPSPHQQPRQQEQQEDDEPSYQNTEVVKAVAAAAKTPTPNGTAAGDSAMHEPELNGNAGTSAPKENGHQLPEAATESTPATTNGTLHPHPQSSTNQLPTQHQQQTDQTHSTTANGGINTISSNARMVPENGVPERKPPTNVTVVPTTDVTAAAATAADAVAASANAAADDHPTPTTTGAAVSQSTAGLPVRVDKVTQTPPVYLPTTTPPMLMVVPKSSTTPLPTGGGPISGNSSNQPYPNLPTHQHPFPSYHYHATNVTLNNLNNNTGNGNTRSPLLIAQYQQPHLIRAGFNNNTKSGLLCDVPVGATTTELPPGVLYRVKATYKYVREDVDELSFEVGDVINVVEYEDPEDQEEGWLMGTKDGTNEKGMFPANFTRPL